VEYEQQRECAFGLISPIDVTIANGQSLSGACDLYGWDLVGILTPVAWTAADITFAANYSATGGTFYGIWNAAGEVSLASASVPTSARRLFALNPQDFLFAQQVEVRSGTETAAVNQGGTRTVTLLRRRL